MGGAGHRMETQPEGIRRIPRERLIRKMVTRAAKESKESAPIEGEATETPSSEVSTSGILWGKVDNLADARNLLESHYGAVLSSGNLFGDGAEFIKDKNVMVGIPFMILDFRFITDPDTEREYVSVLVMNGAGEKARFNDGSTGIYAQLKQVHAEYGVIGITCKNGLRKSDYAVEIDGKKEKAVTYYLSA